MNQDLLNKTIQDFERGEVITREAVTIGREIQGIKTALVSCPIEQVLYRRSDGETSNLFVVSTLLERLLEEDVRVSELIGLKNFRAYLVIELPEAALAKNIKDKLEDIYNRQESGEELDPRNLGIIYRIKS